MIQGKYISTDAELSAYNSILSSVFSNDLSSIDDSVMNNKLLSLYKTEDSITYTGAGRITYDLDYFVIDNVCVLPEYRHHKYGDFIVRILADKAIECGAKKVYAYCPKEYVSLFENIGFTKTEDSEKPICYGFPTIANNNSAEDSNITDVVLYELIPSNFCTQCGKHNH